MRPTATFETLRCFADARGLVVEPLHSTEMPAQRNAHLVLTAPGGVRGNHWHRKGTEVFVVIGPARVRLRDGEGGEVRDVEVGSDQPVKFLIPPGVAHAIQNTGQQLMVLMAFNTESHDPEAPDVVRDILIPT